jgi:IMP and pyridine-specific 5'-nucleotidase
VFVDVGNKSLGLEALMGYLGLSPAEVLHVGDRFSDTGNDSATRDCCSILWVANPEETGALALVCVCSGGEGLMGGDDGC